MANDGNRCRRARSGRRRVDLVAARTGACWGACAGALMAVVVMLSIRVVW